MDPPHHPLHGLHHYALLGDDEGVRRALRDGVDVNAADATGRTAIMCAVAGENWRDTNACDASFMTPRRLNVLKLLLNCSETSLFTLNAPHSSMNGVIPLGMAAWLNQPQAVRILLEESAECVSVDGMDSHGATALMYAARDGSLEVVQLLLSHGARPDFRDRNHRTSVQFALSHPRILWLLESVLRRHRWRESKSADRTRLSRDSDHLVELACSAMPFTEDLEPPPSSIFTKEATSRLTDNLISSIRLHDVAFIHSLLFAPSIPASSPPALYPMSVPILVNIPDSKGWSPVHHCVTVPEPSIEILDALYCSGADISLFTTHEQQTPLHILAGSAHSQTHIRSLLGFALHLIQDLRAPLSARDKDDETCLHIAAEHGDSIDLLLLLLDCDTTGAVRRMKNSRGLTPEDVCKWDFLPAFRQHVPRSPSALSNCTIRASESFASLASISELEPLVLNSQSDSSSIHFASQLDVDSLVQSLLSNLRVTSPEINHDCLPAHIHRLEDCIDQVQEQCNSIVVHFRGRIEETTRVVQELQSSVQRINSLRNMVALAAKGKLLVREIAPLPLRRRHRDSEDSQHTFVLEDHSMVSQASTIPQAGLRSTGTQTTLLDLMVANSISNNGSSWTDVFQRTSATTACKTYFEDLCDVERELAQLQELSLIEDNTNASPTKLAARFKVALKKKRKLEEKIQELDLDRSKADYKQASLSGTSRVKAWLKRMVVQHQELAPKRQIVMDLDDPKCNVGREVKRTKPASTKTTCHDAIDASIDTALRTSQVVLEGVQYDLQSITECLDAARQFIDMANHSILRTQRVVKRAVRKREDMLKDLHTKSSEASKLSVEGLLSPGHLGYSNAVTNRSSLASISTIYSTASSIISVAATLTEHDDDDTRVVRRLLLRKIEAQTSGAWDEIDRVNGWLQIVKESVRGVKRRAYL